MGIAVLPADGVAVVSDNSNDSLHVLRLSDGARVMSTNRAARTPEASFVAADPTTRTIYVCAHSAHFGVCAFRWDGTSLMPEGFLEAAGYADRYRPLAVMPPAPGRLTSYLIVGEHESPTLHVLSLPGRRLVHVHTLEGMEVMGLAADPSGTALAVCDRASKSVHILPWPLPGMPGPLEAA
jgi:hypothetical protein